MSRLSSLGVLPCLFLAFAVSMLSAVDTAPAITSVAPTTAVVGTAYTYTITTTGTPAPTLSVTGNPAWLTLSGSTLSGTPTTTGTVGPITITANNDVTPNATQTFSIVVNAAPAITSVAPTTAVVGTAYSYTITTTGTPAPTLSITGNPAWLTLSGNRLSGTATTAGTVGPITITANNGVIPNAAQTFSITVSTGDGLVAAWALDEAAWTGAVGEVRDRIGTSHGQALGGATTDPGLIVRSGRFIGGLSQVSIPDTQALHLGTLRTVAGWVKIEAENREWLRLIGKGTSGQRDFGLWRAGDGSLLFQFLTTTGWTNVQGGRLAVGSGWRHLAGTSDGTTAILYLDGREVARAGTSGTPVISTAPVTLGQVDFYGGRLTGGLDEIRLYNRVLTPAEVLVLAGAGSIAPAITSVAPTTAKVGTAYSYTITTTGTPAPTLSVTGNPAWLTLSGSTLSGTPTTAGTVGPITITANNDVTPNATQTFSITVNAAPAITSVAPTTAKVGTAYSYTITTSGTPAPTLSVSGNPAWLTLSGSTLSGTPTTAGTVGPITITANNGVNPNATQTFSIVVSPALVAPVITSIAPTTAVVGATYSYAITTTGTPAPTLSVSGNPAWLTLSGSTLSGTATTAGTIGPITITANNGVNPNATQTFSIVVNAVNSDTTDDLKGTITARGENGNEGKAQAFDNQSGTKWLDFSPQGSWIQYTYATGIAGKLSAYTITSANDWSARDPADWQLLGSNDGGTTWTTVDSRTGQSFSARFQKQTFTLSGSPTYKAYRLKITKVLNLAGANSVQLAEIELIGQQVNVTGNSDATSVPPRPKGNG